MKQFLKRSDLQEIALNEFEYEFLHDGNNL